MRRLTTLVTALAVLVSMSAIPATALVTEPGPCWFVTSPEFVGPGYADVSPTSPHADDIECIWFWDITVSTGTFDTASPVSRWQMALFLTRTYEAATGVLPSGLSSSFTDIGSLPADQQTAINQLRDLGVTSGVGAGIYAPGEPVSRWQMALFLTRLIHATGVGLPAPGDTGFTDIGGLSAEAATAISQLQQLGITSGTSATQFSPDAFVTREQMASFLSRTLAAVWIFNPVFESETYTCDTNSCTGSGIYWRDLPFTLGGAWVIDLPYPSPSDERDFQAADTRLEITLDGSPLVLTEQFITLPGFAIRRWTVDFPAGLTGLHTITYRYLMVGIVEGTHTFTFDFGI